MPRLPFTRGNRAVAAPMFCLSALAVAGAVQASTPSPQITALATRGQAPFTVHVHGLNSALGAGDESIAANTDAAGTGVRWRSNTDRADRSSLEVLQL